MGNRFRHIVVATVALVASTIAFVGASAPAQADVGRGPSCTSPTITGSVLPTVTSEGSYGLRLSASGSAPATCTSYRWIVTLQSQATGPVQVVSQGLLQPRGSAYGVILFPSATFRAPQGPGLMALQVRTQLNAGLLYLPVSTQTYYLTVPDPTFSTSTLSTAPGTATCDSNTIPGPIVGHGGWC